jgi:Putative viral replication protein
MAIPIAIEACGFDYGLFDRLIEEELTHTTSVTEEDFFASVFTPFSYSPPPMSRAKHWCFTLNNYQVTDIDRINALDGEVDYLIYGKEVGASGTPHLQGFVSFKTRVRRALAIERIGQAHFTVARNVDAAIEYCKKEGDLFEFGTRPKGPGSRSDLEEFKQAVVAGERSMKTLRHTFSDVVARYPKFCSDFVQDNTPRKIVDPFPLFLWQQTLYHDLSLVPCSRKIIFIVDRTGNMGKSWFCHYYAGLHHNTQVLLPGKKADMSYVLDQTIRVLFVDAPRSKQGEYLQYDFLEDVKNGYVFCPKYESSIKYLGPMHIIVMMNESPDLTKLSLDRYDIREI